jgi:LysR family glycine cleavage system transcriptional activator
MDWRKLPSLSALRAFAALAQAGSFSRAGAALNVSHAAVSQHVRALEADLGVPLIVHGNRRAELTPEGERLAAALGGAFDAIGTAVEDLRGTEAARPLQVTMTPAFAVQWLMPRISEFRHEHPGIEMMLNPTAEVVEVGPGAADVAIRYGRGGWPGLEVEMLLPTAIAIVAASTLVDGLSIERPQDILELPWLQEFGTNEMTNWLRERGVLTPKSENVTHLPGYLVLDGLRNGQGVSAVARALVEPDIAEGRLKVLFEDAAPNSGYYIATRPGVPRPPLKAFLRWLRRHSGASGTALTAVA